MGFEPGEEYGQYGDTTVTVEAAAAARDVVSRSLVGADLERVLSMLFDPPKSRLTRTPVQLAEGVKLPAHAKTRIRDLLTTGASDAAIAEQLGVSRQAVTGVRTNPPRTLTP